MQDIISTYSNEEIIWLSFTLSREHVPERRVDSLRVSLIAITEQI